MICWRRVRWQQTLDPDKNRGEWTKEELKRLEEAVASCEKGNWVEVAKKVRIEASTVNLEHQLLDLVSHGDWYSA